MTTEIITPQQLNFAVHKTPQQKERIREEVLALLAQYPKQFVPGLSDDYIQADFNSGWVVTGATQDSTIIATVMFDTEVNEYNWLAVDASIPRGKRQIGKALFEAVYPLLPANSTVCIKPNTEDAYIPGIPEDQFHGKYFAPARNLYANIMGLPLATANRIENAYGEGQHVYEVKWVVNQQA